LTYALLAERADVTRQTLYRHWPDRAGLLFDIVLEGPDVAGYPEPSVDPHAGVTAWLKTLREGASMPAMRLALLAILAQADHHPESQGVLVRIGVDRCDALNRVLAPSGVQVSADEYTMLTGPLLTRLLLERGSVTDAFIESIVTQWLSTLQRSSAAIHADPIKRPSAGARI
jgi:AcrR family transcriptional regulator